MESHEIDNRFWEMMRPVAIEWAARDADVRMLANLAFRRVPVSDERRQIITERVRQHYGLNEDMFEHAIAQSFMTHLEKRSRTDG